MTDQQILCWGDTDEGLPQPGPGEYVQVEAEQQTCALRTDGKLECWGRDVEGQASPPEGSFVDVSVGLFHSCGLTPMGEPVCWGGEGG